MKKLIFTFLLLFAFGTTCYAAQWIQYGENQYYDRDSIRHMQVDYDSILKIKTKSPFKNGGYSLNTYLINEDNLMYTISVYEDYDSNGNLTNKVNSDPKDKSTWLDGTNSKAIQELLKRAK
jgi:hypothetical protein